MPHKKLSRKQQRAMFSKLQKGDSVRTPTLHERGVFAGKTRKGFKILTTNDNGRPSIVITKQMPVRFKDDENN